MFNSFIFVYCIFTLPFLFYDVLRRGTIFIIEFFHCKLSFFFFFLIRKANVKNGCLALTELFGYRNYLTTASFKNKNDLIIKNTFLRPLAFLPYLQ